MSRKLVFVHGRSQENKDSIALKAEWVEAFRRGLAKSGLALPVAEMDITFPYYGDTLYQLTGGVSPEDAPEVVLRGTLDDRELRRFTRAVLDEVRARFDVTDEQVAEVADRDVVERGIANDEWFQGVLRAIDRFVPGASARSIALATADVFHYLKNVGARDAIDRGVTRAIRSGEETVVVSHSLGTVVAYNVLRQQGHDQRWKIPLFVTLGSPLGVTQIRQSIRGIGAIRCPAAVTAWLNAMDERDVVALYPLDVRHFPLDPATPAIRNKTDVRNETENRHGIGGYLDNAEVARTIHDALAG